MTEDVEALSDEIPGVSQASLGVGSKALELHEQLVEALRELRVDC